MLKLPWISLLKKRLNKKFDISYMIAKEKLAFTKMKSICELEEMHGVDLGAGYKNDHARATFISFIVKEQKKFFLLNSYQSPIFLAFKQMPVLMLETWSLSYLFCKCFC